MPYVTAAIFGLIGVIVGGLLNGVVALWQERRRELRHARPAARLVMHELTEIQAILQADERRGEVGSQVPAPTAWPAARDALSAVVNGRTWTTLERAYEMAEYLIARPEGVLPVRALYGRAWQPFEISRSVYEAQQALKRYADLPADAPILEPIRDPSAPATERTEPGEAPN
jgi:hypothetical protein